MLTLTRPAPSATRLSALRTSPHAWGGVVRRTRTLSLCSRAVQSFQERVPCRARRGRAEEARPATADPHAFPGDSGGCSLAPALLAAWTAAIESPPPPSCSAAPIPGREQRWRQRAATRVSHNMQHRCTTAPPHAICQSILLVPSRSSSGERVHTANARLMHAWP